MSPSAGARSSRSRRLAQATVSVGPAAEDEAEHSSRSSTGSRSVAAHLAVTWSPHQVVLRPHVTAGAACRRSTSTATGPSPRRWLSPPLDGRPASTGRSGYAFHDGDRSPWPSASLPTRTTSARCRCWWATLSCPLWPTPSPSTGCWLRRAGDPAPGRGRRRRARRPRHARRRRSERRGRHQRAATNGAATNGAATNGSAINGTAVQAASCVHDSDDVPCTSTTCCATP